MIDALLKSQLILQQHDGHNVSRTVHDFNFLSVNDPAIPGLLRKHLARRMDGFGPGFRYVGKLLALGVFDQNVTVANSEKECRHWLSLSR